MTEQRTSELQVYLHPLVIINISDHWTRHKMQQANKKTTTSSSSAPKEMRIVGALLGTQEGRKIEIHTSFELTYKIVDGVSVVDTNYLRNKMDQYVQVFKKYEILGWYSSGDKPRPEDNLIHKQIMEFNENPLFLTCGTTYTATTRELPVTIYESIFSINNQTNEVEINFRPINYKIETEESERIAVDHVAHIQDTTGKATNSTLVPHLGGLHNAVKMLNIRIKMIAQYLEAVSRGEVPTDHAVLREISSLCNRLPTIDSPKFATDFQNELNESLLIAYMASMTKGTNQLNELTDKFNTLNERARRRTSMF